MTSDHATADRATGDLHSTAAARLARDGQRYTANRKALVEVLVASDGPLTLPEILDLRDDIPQSSAYRNLSLLEQAGVVHRIVTTDEFARYELAEELTDDHHHHLICSRCGAVSDFTVPPRIEKTLEAALHSAASEQGFSAEHHRFDLVGVCARCRRYAAAR